MAFYRQNQPVTAADNEREMRKTTGKINDHLPLKIHRAGEQQGHLPD
jgi:hypothetical protein